MRTLWGKKFQGFKVLTIASIILILLSFQALAYEQEKPGSGAMFIDVPIRVLGLGLTIVSTAVFIVALPFTLASESTDNAWETLVVEPFEFTFSRPLGQFDDWRPDDDSIKGE